jgi:hypothetical protein
MKGSMVRLMALGLLIGVGVAACATDEKAPSSPEVASLTAARAKLTSDLEACTAAHGYDPQAVSGVAENALAPGELDWRECAYNAARTYARANPPMRLDYELLIHEDRSMTEQIQQGTMTRSERRAKIDARIAEIKAEEERQLEAAEAAAEADQAQLRNTVDSLRGFAL